MDAAPAIVAEKSTCGFRALPPGAVDALDVSLHDSALAEEVELTVRLIVAANEAERTLCPREVDELLEVGRKPLRTMS